ncbi:Uncharacterised protein [Mycobacteroides abscessus subsp. massiliense]|nr:Uncharacterised protein [Mycobacteroides abscessus subsp. massiliense]SKH40652.1 Uncharacterised protein [Mycobacteroides abscessus subsp. massiliense]SKH90391.1 Uncharacterised protein [Mycobacteroides abscessus subsp. massiliense]SKK83725.1 Uncharacterised protein [Mycobacteroides abscessus subsp. massiliense]SKK90153.1 Uncharacterised protein [Mycobacteroides abscessus subsp. massiliense]
MLRTRVQGSSSVQRSRALTGNGMWAAIAAAVLYHEINCREGELLSEAVDRGLAKHPVPIYVLVLVTAAHLLNWLPSQTDPYHLIGVLFKKSKGKHD